jgi:DNA-binding transcriptional LysR family regulator
MDRLTGLTLFVAAVENGSLAAAGRRLAMTPAMAGKYLAALEAELGVRLLHRTTRKLSLTDVGRAYFERSKRILEEMEDADSEARNLHGEPRGTLRVTAPMTFGALHLGVPIAKFISSYPEASVEMTLDDRYVDLVESGLEMAIRIGHLPDSSLIARRIAPCRMVACASPTYLTRKGFPQSPADLAAFDLLSYNMSRSRGSWTFTDSAGRASSSKGTPRLRTNNVQLLQTAALNDGGIAYGPSFVFGSYLVAGALRQVLPHYKTTTLAIHVVYPSSRNVTAKVRRFADLLGSTFGEEPPWDNWLRGRGGAVR